MICHLTWEEHPLRFPEVLGSYFSPGIFYLDRDFSHFPQSLPTNTGRVPQVGSRPLPHTSFPINDPSIGRYIARGTEAAAYISLNERWIVTSNSS
jgi:hypothetical protein